MICQFSYRRISKLDALNADHDDFGLFHLSVYCSVMDPAGRAKKEEKRLRPLHTGTIHGSPNWVLGGFRGTRRSRKDGGAVRP